MKRISLTVAALLILGSAGVMAAVPDADNSSVEPWDTYGQAFVAPGGGSPLLTNVDEVTVTVRNSDGDPISGAEVLIDLGQGSGLTDECPNLCLDPIDPGLTGVTNTSGIAVLNPRVGGCDNCSVLVKADGVTIAFYDSITSTDWDGSAADGAVTGADFAFFAAAFKSTQDPCADYNGDDAVTGTDFAFFASSFKGGDANPNGCD